MEDEGGKKKKKRREHKWEEEGVAILRRVVRKGFDKMMTFGQRPEEKRDQVLQMSKRKIIPEGPASAENLRQRHIYDV